MLRVALALALTALVVVATANVAVELVSDDPVVRGTRAAGLVWAERVFTSKREFASYLSSRGASYEAWAARHPGAAPWEPSVEPGAPTPRSSRVRVGGSTALPGTGSAAAATPAASDGDDLDWPLAPITLAIAVGSLVLLLLLRLRRLRLCPAGAASPLLDEADHSEALARRRAFASATGAVAVVARPVAAALGGAGLRLTFGAGSWFAALRQASREGNVTAVVVTTYSLGVVSAAGVGLLVAYLSGH